MDGRANTRVLRWVLLTGVAVSAASCGPPEPEESAGEMEVSSEPQPRHDGAGDDERLEQHMQQMSSVPADSLLLVMPMHLETVGAILGEMDPAYMGMQSDTVWRSTLDSVQNDLARMRDMRVEDLRVFMPEHSRRIERLILLHDSAMGTER